MKILVTAGGQGTKLWPYSRQDKPKQFQPIIGDKSSYQQTIETLLRKFAPEDIYISTKRKFIKYVSEQSPQIPLKNYIVEPDVAKDRGPGEGLAFLRLDLLHPDEPFFLVQADCMRRPEEAFLQMIDDAEQLVKRDRKFVTGGIKATEPNLGVDYLQLGERVRTNTKQAEIYEVKSFLGRRASHRETKELIENFHIVTHCNHSCWYPGLMLEAYKKYRPDWYEALMQIKEVIDKPGEDAAIEKIYAEMEKGATEEVTKHVMADAYIMLVPYKWTDVGTWSSVYEYCDETGASCNSSKVVTLDADGSLIKCSNPNKLVALAGVENMVIIDTEDVLMVIPNDKLEKIKELQAKLTGDDKAFL